MKYSKAVCKSSNAWLKRLIHAYLFLFYRCRDHVQLNNSVTENNLNVKLCTYVTDYSITRDYINTPRRWKRTEKFKIITTWVLQIRKNCLESTFKISFGGIWSMFNKWKPCPKRFHKEILEGIFQALCLANYITISM